MVIQMEKQTEYNSKISFFFSGILMGAADAVPGVSGGTIALILGIYRRLIKAIFTILESTKNRFSSASQAEFRLALAFLLPLVLGMFLSYYVVTKILVGPEDNPGLLLRNSTAPYVFSFFFGLVLFSIKEPWSFVKNPRITHYLLVLLGFIIVSVFSVLTFDSNGTNSFFLIFGGALALTAMLLPGVSGALVLLTLGQYTLVVTSFHEGNFVPIFYLMIGGLFSIFTFVPAMYFMIENHIEVTMSLLTGLMCGSLITLWPWKSDYNSQGLSYNIGFFETLGSYSTLSILLSVIFALLGIFSSSFLMHAAAKRKIRDGSL
mgnify:CR=1 FL=1